MKSLRLFLFSQEDLVFNRFKFTYLSRRENVLLFRIIYSFFFAFFSQGRKEQVIFFVYFTLL